MGTYLDDSRLTLEVLTKVVRAQQRGTLPHTLHVTRYPTQVVLGNGDADVLAWARKNFPDGALEPHGTVRKRGKHRWEETRYVAYLRPPIKDGERFARPRIEVWGVQVPHVCHEFVGHARDTGVTWKCTAYTCGKRITKTRARELGLLP